MDSLHFHLKELFPLKSFSTIEIDYSDITKEKIKLIKSSKLVKKQFEELNDSEKISQIISSDKKNFITDNYRLIECDLSDKEKLIKCINDAGFSKENLTVIIAECLLCYMHSDEIANLLKLFTNKFENCVFIYYDLINPNDDFGKMMIKNLKSYREISLPSYHDCPDIKSHIERMKNSGFENNFCVDMLDYYNNYINESLKKKVSHLEFIDELEEFNLLQMHSCLGISIKKSDDKLFEFLNNYKLN